VHRVGRTARANTKGEAFTLVNPKDMPRLKRIEDLIESEIPKEAMPEEIGKAPEWRTTKGGKPNHPSKNKNFKGKKKWHPKKKKDGNNNKPNNSKGNA
jgi:superfamily II DNA/RNA helicase